MPEFLFHYTNVETLAMILKNRTIRFKSLDQMDDKQEQQSADAKKAGQITFVSCWTEDENDSIPMWNMYSSLSAGVRIKMKSIPFKYQDTDFDLIQKLYPNTKITIEGIPKTFVPYSEMMLKKFSIFPNSECGILHRVQYTSEKEKLCPQIIQRTEDHTGIDLNSIGMYKNNSWSFQNEWRYIVRILGFDIAINPDKAQKEMLQVICGIINGDYIQPFSHYDMLLDDNAFANMTIRPSPAISAGNRIIVENLVEKYNPTAVVEDSPLHGTM